MSIQNTTPAAEPATPSRYKTITRMGRKQFNAFLFDLYGRDDKNDVTADAVYESDDFFVEAWKDSPAGPMIAVHHSFAGLNYQVVDVMRPTSDGLTSDAGGVAVKDERRAA